MKRQAIFCFLLGLSVSAAGAELDVNRDGRIDQDDVAALARMVAGIDQIDLRFDQDGDGLLTMEDVNRLLDATRPQPDTGSSAAVAAAGARSATSTQGVGAIAFYAVRQKNSGQCVVVAGDEGLSAGDTIYGVFASFQEAQDQIKARCAQGTAEPAASGISGKMPLNHDRLYRPDETITRGTWGNVVHLAEDAVLANKINEAGVDVIDGFFVSPGHGGDTEILWSHDGSTLTLSGVASVIDCIDYCGRAGTIEFFIRGDGRNLWSSGLIRQNDASRPFSVSLTGVRDVRLVATSGGNGVDEDWGGWLNLSVGGEVSPRHEEGNSAADIPVTGGSPTIAIAEIDGDDSTRGIFLVNLENGEAVLIDEVRRTALDVSTRPMKHNFFDAVGRSHHQPAQTGQLLVGSIRAGGGQVHALLIVDTTTGEMGYLTGLDDDPRGKNLKRINGAPAKSLANPDGNFALVMRRTGSGKTTGAYLIHATSGRGVLFDDIDKLSVTIHPAPITSLPKTSGAVSSLEIQSGSDATASFLLIDQVGGAVHHVGGVSRKPTRLTVRTLPHNLVRAFPKDPPVPSHQRFSTIPVTDRSGATDSALIVDVGSGAMAMIENLGEPSKTRLVGINRSIYELLPKDVGLPRTISAVPRINSNAATEGGWLMDSGSSDMVFLDNLHEPDNLFMGLVEISSSY